MIVDFLKTSLKRRFKKIGKDGTNINRD